MPRVIHFEIHADDPQRAIQFYSSVFAWEFTKWEGPQDYWHIKTGPDDEPGINGGMIRRRGAVEDQAVIAYVCTIDVPSVDDYVRRILAAGGTVAVSKMSIQGVGWLAFATDTEGNIFGMMEADTEAR